MSYEVRSIVDRIVTPRLFVLAKLRYTMAKYLPEKVASVVCPSHFYGNVELGRRHGMSRTCVYCGTSQFTSYKSSQLKQRIQQYFVNFIRRF